MSSGKQKIIVTGAPDCCTLRQIKKHIGAYLTNGEDAVKKVKKCKTNTGEVVLGKFEVELMQFEGKKKD